MNIGYFFNVVFIKNPELMGFFNYIGVSLYLIVQKNSFGD